MTARALQSLRDDLSRVRRVWIVAAGKAAAGMARAAAEAVGDRLVAGVATAADLPGLDARWTAYAASHPLPNKASEAAGRAALALAAEVREPDDLLLVCLSGGASAMLCAPAPGLTIADKRVVNDQLLRAGLDIGAMNVVRRHLSAVKGGQLAAAAGRSITLAISDVTMPIDDDPLTIGSGPTVGDTTTFADALATIDAAGLRDDAPRSVVQHLEAGVAGRVTGPVPADDPRLQRAAYWIVASRRDAMRAAAETARQLDYNVSVVDTALRGDARAAHEAIFAHARDLSWPACVICSGETTVRVVGSGRGGRSQELLVAALELLSQMRPTALASIGTDGIDGPTDAAGGIVDGDMWSSLGQDAGAIISAALDNNDAYPLLERLGGLVKTGPTGTNVCDLQVLLLG